MRQAATLLIRGSLLGMAYVMFLPFVGMTMLAWVLGERVFSRASTKSRPFARNS